MMIIDGHISLAIPEKETTPYDRFLEQHVAFKGYKSGKQLITDMDKDGVDVGIILHGNNDHRLALANRYPQRLIAFAGVQMDALSENSKKELQKIRHLIISGCRGIGEVRLFSHGFGVDEPFLHALVELAIEMDVPIHFECTSTIGEYHPGRLGTMLYDFERLAILFPKLKMILSSWGGGLCLFEMMPELPKLLSNVYYSTASPVDDYDIGLMMRTVHKVCYPRKILYGSLSPHRKRQLDVYKNSGAPKEVVQAVMGLNLAALLGISTNGMNCNEFKEI
jgi:hypothetical protein